MRLNAGFLGRVSGQFRETVSPSWSSDVRAERIRDGVSRLMRPICGFRSACEEEGGV